MPRLDDYNVMALTHPAWLRIRNALLHPNRSGRTGNSRPVGYANQGYDREKRAEGDKWTMDDGR